MNQIHEIIARRDLTPNQRLILIALAAVGEGEMSVYDIAALLGTSDSAVTKMLNQLWLDHKLIDFVRCDGRITTLLRLLPLPTVAV